ncbi:MAG: hypothetical protein E7625_03165 [Ruminococcaceae bacterium]|nr:hypothetical protein [Oscillospiraceae bacterium]
MKLRSLLLLLALLMCLGALVACRNNTPPDVSVTPGGDTEQDPPPEGGDDPGNPGTPGGNTPGGDTEVNDKYIYPEEEYEAPLELFGKWEDNFAPGQRTNKYGVVVSQAASGLYTQTRGEVATDGPRTYASVDHGYSAAMHLNVDAYVVSPQYKKEFDKAGYKLIGMSGSFNKSEYSKNHPEVLQTGADGKTDAFWGSSVLTREVVEFNIDASLRDRVRNGNWTVGYVEPEMFRYGTYGKAYKDLWALKYGEEWSDPAATVRSVFLSQRLNVWTHTNAIKMYSSFINQNEKKNTPLLYSLAPHSTLAYATYPNGITDGYVHMMGTGQVESVTGQTWSNTIQNAIRYEGMDRTATFINAYVDYGTYLDAVNYYDTYFFALCDPMSDTSATLYDESYWRELCHQQLVASMMYSEINAWELIWANRSFMNVSPDYRSEQLNIHNALLEISGAEYKATAGTPGITYLLGDTLTWQDPNKRDFGENAYDGFWGVAGPLVYDGIPLRTMAMELITKAEDLENVSVLIVSYDNQKPLYEELNVAIADWVKKGGTLLYLGGPDEYLTIPEAWWNREGKGGSLTANLLDHLGQGSTISAKTLTGGNRGLVWKGGETAADAGDYADGLLKAGGDNFTYYYEGTGFETILETEDGKAVGISFAAGEGQVLMVGLSTTDYSDSAAAADLMRMLTAKATTYTDYSYVTSDAFVVERGDYVALYPLNGDYRLEGTYVNIFTPDLRMEIDPVVKAGEAALYLRVKSTSELTVPTVMFAGGFVQSIEQTANMTNITLYAAENALIPIRIAAPEGMVPTVSSVSFDGNDTRAEQIWDPETNSLVIRTFSSPSKYATVTVAWRENTEPLHDVAYKSFKVDVNSSGADASLIHVNTGGADGKKRYCDGKSEIIWKMDVSRFRGLTIAVALSQNYMLEVSGDGVNWQTVINYRDISTMNATTGTNDGIACILVGAYANINSTLYIRLSNANAKTNGSWGGAIKSFTFQYLVSDESETLTIEDLKPVN